MGRAVVPPVAFTVNGIESESEFPELLVTRNIKAFAVPTTAGVPEMTPLLDKLRPDGSVPACNAHVGAGVPVAASVKLYETPATAGIRDAVVTTGAEFAPAALTVSVSGRSSSPKALVARKVIDPLAVVVGVPERTPPELKLIPVGNVPLCTVQVIGAVPVAVNVVVG